MTFTPPSYVYHIYDSVKDTYISSIGLSGVTFSNVINGGGSFTGTLSISDPLYQAGALEWQNATDYRMNRSMWIERNGVIVWAGFVSGRSYDSSSQTLTLTGTTFETFSQFRFLRVPLVYTNMDILTVARNIWRTQQVNSWEPTWQYDTNLSGKLVTFNSMQWWAYINDYMSTLVDMSPGVEWYIDTYYDPTVVSGPPQVKKKFYVATPTLPAVDVGLTVSSNPSGGNLLSYTLAEDGTKFATKMYSLGSGSDSAQVYGEFFDTTLLDEGFMDVSLMMTNADITDKPTLTGMAKQAILKATSQLYSFDVVVKPDESFDIQNVKLGRLVTIDITDPRFPQGYQGQSRIIDYTVTPGDDGEESIAVTLEPIYNA